MKKILTCFVLVAFVLGLPFCFVGCNKKGGSSTNSIVGIWVYEKMESDAEYGEYSQEELEGAFEEYKTYKYTFRSDGTGKYTGTDEKGEHFNTAFTWEIVEIEGHTVAYIVEQTEKAEDSYYLFENGRLTKISVEGYYNDHYVYGNIIYKKG